MDVKSEKLLGLLYIAYKQARLGKRKTADEQKFELNLTMNLAQLCEEIMNRSYRPSRGIAFITRKPVIREIFAAPFRDRVVHHLIYNLVASFWDKRFIYDKLFLPSRKGDDVWSEEITTSYHERAG